MRTVAGVERMSCLDLRSALWTDAGDVAGEVVGAVLAEILRCRKGYGLGVPESTS